MRVAKALSLLGHCSRREAERLIAAGRVSIDGTVVPGPATLVDPTSQALSVDGREIAAPERRVYLAVHKPTGVTSTLKDPHAERTITQLAPGMGRLYPVGRLDKDSEGLILLTNDGEFANKVSHPRYEVSREYLALVSELPSPEALRKLRHGIMLDGRRATPALVEAAPKGPMPPDPSGRGPRGSWVRIVLREGRNREVRRLLAAIGCTVLRLVRTRIGPIRPSGLRVGQYRPLRSREVQNLMKWSEAHEPELEVEDLDEVDEATASGLFNSIPVARNAKPLVDERRPDRLVIAIDGPAAAGKTTVGKLLAERLTATFLDTGVLYRALTLNALEAGVDVEDAPSLASLAETLEVHVKPTADGGEAILLGGRDITSDIRSEAVDNHVSQVAQHPDVRGALVQAQRRAAEGQAAVVVGRDIGTVIFPDANIKLFLEASEAERGRRRIAQLELGDQSTVRERMAQRDQTDRGRAVAPLVPASDAVVIDTDGMSAQDVVEQVLELVEERFGDASPHPSPLPEGEGASAHPEPFPEGERLEGGGARMRARSAGKRRSQA